MTCVGRFLAVIFCPGQVACAALLWLRLVTQGRLAWAPLIHFAYFAKGHTTWEQVTSIQNLMMPVDPVSLPRCPCGSWAAGGGALRVPLAIRIQDFSLDIAQLSNIDTLRRWRSTCFARGAPSRKRDSRH